MPFMSSPAFTVRMMKIREALLLQPSRAAAFGGPKSPEGRCGSESARSLVDRKAMPSSPRYIVGPSREPTIGR
jgi:hypothetical protein